MITFRNLKIYYHMRFIYFYFDNFFNCEHFKGNPVVKHVYKHFKIHVFLPLKFI